MGVQRVTHDSKFQLQKYAAERFDNCDGISCLPNHILVVILSSLPLKEAGRTSVLSSRWKNLWQQTSRLNFDASSALVKIARDYKLDSEEGREYVRWVNSVLKSLPSKQALTLEHFKICFGIRKAWYGTITKWLEFAFERRVEKLELQLQPYKIDYDQLENKYVFPEDILFRNSSDIPHHSTTLFNFNSLKELCLTYVSISDEGIKFFLCNCSLLEQLVLEDVNQLSNLEVCGASLVLKRLYVMYCSDLVSIKVSAPNLTSLAVMEKNELVFESVLMLESVPMLVDLDILCRREKIPLLAPALFCCFSQLKILTLRLQTYKACAIVWFKFPEMHGLKKLVVILRTTYDETLIGLMTFIRISPNLEELVLKVTLFSGLALGRREVNEGTPFPHQHLKVLKYLGYHGHGSDLDVVKFISENCVRLQQIIIGTAKPLDLSHRPPHPANSKYEQVRRSYAKQQLEPIILPHITFTIL
ncbi:unnamed protein product [Cuscuta epithymum]|uniref:F-box domain-containing protein n=1 Tax=Cuscuta epithymum TaxID=186058 RepID=A0AAV0BWG5_9ASTE|nr:unnamed protein product [Cuscuta epithymum]